MSERSSPIVPGRRGASLNSIQSYGLSHLGFRARSDPFPRATSRTLVAAISGQCWGELPAADSAKLSRGHDLKFIERETAPPVIPERYMEDGRMVEHLRYPGKGVEMRRIFAKASA